MHLQNAISGNIAPIIYRSDGLLQVLGVLSTQFLHKVRLFNFRLIIEEITIIRSIFELRITLPTHIVLDKFDSVRCNVERQWSVHSTWWLGMETLYDYVRWDLGNTVQYQWFGYVQLHLPCLPHRSREWSITERWCGQRRRCGVPPSSLKGTLRMFPATCIRVPGCTNSDPHGDSYILATLLCVCILHSNAITML